MIYIIFLKKKKKKKLERHKSLQRRDGLNNVDFV
jgi:hypothetical protein